jgi:hypothetical protein
MEAGDLQKKPAFAAHRLYARVRWKFFGRMEDVIERLMPPNSMKNFKR